MRPSDRVSRTEPGIYARLVGAPRQIVWSPFCLFITGVDPIPHGLLFERFLNPERAGMPDIDIDVQSDRRDELIQLRRANISASSMPPWWPMSSPIAPAWRCAIPRKRWAFPCAGQPADQSIAPLQRSGADALRGALMTSCWTLGRREQLRSRLLDDAVRTRLALALQLAARICGLPRHLSLHNGGMVLTREPLSKPASSTDLANGVRALEVDKDDVERLGLIKFDLLGLRTLGRHRGGTGAHRGNHRRPPGHRSPSHHSARSRDHAPHSCRPDAGRLSDRIARPVAPARPDAARDLRRPHRPDGALSSWTAPGQYGPPLYYPATGYQTTSQQNTSQSETRYKLPGMRPPTISGPRIRYWVRFYEGSEGILLFQEQILEIAHHSPASLMRKPMASAERCRTSARRRRWRRCASGFLPARAARGESECRRRAGLRGYRPLCRLWLL